MLRDKILLMKSKHSKIIASCLIMGLMAVVFIAVRQTNQPQDVPFSVFEKGYSLMTPPGLPGQTTEPPLIIIASREDMNLPSELTFPEPLAERLKQLDLEKSFVVLVHRGHPDRGLVKTIIRKQEKVFITTYDVDNGPGNYVVLGWTQPYEFIKIDKTDKWNEQIHFILQRETQGILAETDHFIP